MAKPTTIITWATDSGATSDPGPTRRASGFIAGKKLPAKWLNWLLNQNAAWLTYLRDLHAEPEYLNKLYKWTGQHSFTNGAGTFVAGNLLLGGEVQYVLGDGSTLTSKERRVLVPLSSGTPCGLGASSARFVAPGYWYWPDSSGQLAFPLRFAENCLPQSVRLGATFHGSGTGAVSALVYHKDIYLKHADPDSITATAISTGGEPYTMAPGTSHMFTLDVSSASYVYNEFHEFYLVIDGQVDCRIHWVDVRYFDFGPRNF